MLPFSMYIQETSANKYKCPHKVENCWGRNCMAWRWMPVYAGPPSTQSPATTTPIKFSAELGHCGLVK